jgi:hypothetical protein
MVCPQPALTFYRMIKMERRQKRFPIPLIFHSVGLMLFLLLTAIFLLAAEKSNAGERIMVGEVEDVLLLPWRVKLPARIDTGAATSSLDARELKVKNDMAEFKLPKKYGGILLRLPIIDWKHIRGADFKERRPVVEITLCIGPKLIRTRVTLNDRSMVRYPLIVGRNILKDNFVVDCVQANCLPPSCPEVSSQ